MAKGWYNGAVYQVGNVSHFIGRADGLLVVLIILAARVRGRAMLSPWLAEGVGRKTRARIDMRNRNIL